MGLRPPFLAATLVVLYGCGARTGLLHGDAPATTAVCSPVLPTELWHDTTSNPFNGTSAVAIDKKGVVHIAFGTWDDLQLATNAEGSWRFSTIDDSTSADLALVADGEGKLHCAWHGWRNNKVVVRYAARGDDGHWAKESVEIAHDKVLGTALAVDADGRAHVAFADYKKGDLRHAERHDGVWSVETVPGAGQSNVALAASAGGVVHATFYGSYPGDMGMVHGLLHATNETARGWNVESVASDAVLANSSLVLDDAGAAHVTFEANQEPRQWYATNAAGSWRVELIDDKAGGTNAMARASDGSLHLTYVSGHRLWYATNRSGSWIKTDLDPQRDVGWWSSSVAVAPNGGIHISYRDDDRGDLVYAVLCP
jgi:hypothetical protein